MTDKTLNYEPLHEFAVKNRVSYNELCVAVRAALAAQPAEPVVIVESKHGDPERFGEREIRALAAIRSAQTE